MSDRAERPLLFLDVDGPLLRFGVDPQRGELHGSRWRQLNPRIGLQLAALPCELVWATTWEDEANTEISPRIGLPVLRVVHWPESSAGASEDTWFGLCWKTRTLVDWADGRAFAWVDDEITDADRDWVSANHRGRALLYHVQPSLGLTDEDLAVLDQWLRTCRA